MRAAGKLDLFDDINGACDSTEVPATTIQMVPNLYQISVIKITLWGAATMESPREKKNKKVEVSIVRSSRRNFA